MKYISLIDSFSNYYFLLPEVLRKAFFKKINEGNWLIFYVHCTVMSFMYTLELV